MFPAKIHHYYEQTKGPLRTMSDLPPEDLRILMEELSRVDTPGNRIVECTRLGHRPSASTITGKYSLQTRKRAVNLTPT
jgi:hypothetical protein